VCRAGFRIFAHPNLTVPRSSPTCAGEFSNSDGQTGQLAIAFVTDLIPSWQSTRASSDPLKHGEASAKQAYLNESVTSMDLSHNISRELSMSPAVSPADHTTKHKDADYASAPDSRAVSEASPLDTGTNPRVPFYSYF